MSSPETDLSTMRAAVYTSTSPTLTANLSYSTTSPRPTALREGSSLVRVAYAALNPADYKLTEIPLLGRLVAPPPAIPSFDYSGRVVETRNPALRPGQLVFGRLDSPSKWGCAAEFTVAPSAGTIPLPETVDLRTGAALGTAAISAWQSLAPSLTSKPRARVLVNGGSGGTGTWGIQFARALGASHVTATCSAPNAELCRRLGADDVLDYRAQDVAATLSERVKAGAQPFDLVFDTVGSPADLYTAADAFLAPDGAFVQIAGDPSLAGARSVLGRMLWPRLLGGGSRRFQFVGAANDKAQFEAMADIVAQGKASAVVDSVFPLQEAVAAYEKLRTGRARGKVLVEVGGEGV